MGLIALFFPKGALGIPHLSGCRAEKGSADHQFPRQCKFRDKTKGREKTSTVVLLSTLL